MRKLVMAIDEEFPILESLALHAWDVESTALMLPDTLQAPRLRHLILTGFACPIRSRLHPTAMGLVALHPTIGHASAYFQPSVLLHWISFMPQLEMLVILFPIPVPDRDVERAERQLTHTPITTPITLPNLRLLHFSRVSSTFLEAIIRRITTLRLEQLTILFFSPLTFSVPCLVQFLNTTEGPWFDSVELEFSGRRVRVESYLRGSGVSAIAIEVYCWHLDWQVSPLAQNLDALSQVFSTMEHLTLQRETHSRFSEKHNEVDRTGWRNILRSLNDVKTLRVENGLIEEVSRCLRLEDGELPLELLPALPELTYSGSGGAGDGFTSFILSMPAKTQVALSPWSVVVSIPSDPSFEAPAITSASDEAAIEFDT